MVGKLGLSEQRACRWVGVPRSVFRYWSCRADAGPLHQRLRTLTEQYPKYGYPTLYDLLKVEGLVQNLKRICRPYREEGLQVRNKRRNKLKRPCVPMLVPDKIYERCLMGDGFGCWISSMTSYASALVRLSMC